MDHGHIFVVLAVIFGFFMAWGVGANDVANAMGTSVGAKILTVGQALLIAAIFEVAGALLASDQVTATIRSQIINVNLLTATPELFIYGMLAALLSAATWLALATYFGWPVSTTHSVVGAIIGFGAIVLGVHAVKWFSVLPIILSWVLTPFIAGVLAYLLFLSLYRLILNSSAPLRSANYYLPFYIFVSVWVVAVTSLNIGFDRHVIQMPELFMRVGRLGLACVISLLCMIVSFVFLTGMKVPSSRHRKVISFALEKRFGFLTIFTACSVAFAHGANDVANAIGPVSAVINMVNHHGQMSHLADKLNWVPLFGALGIITGLATMGYKVIATVGSDITLLTPSRAFAVQLATASTVLGASYLGLPVSTTQTLVGAVLGVGFARGVSALNFSVVSRIFMSWLITLPVGAFMAIVFFYVLKFIF